MCGFSVAGFVPVGFLGVNPLRPVTACRNKEWAIGGLLLCELGSCGDLRASAGFGKSAARPVDAQERATLAG